MKMEIKDLQPKQGNVNITVQIVDKGEIREFQKFGRTGKVCTSIAKDASGEINFSLWNEQVDMVNKGDTVKVTNGYVNEYQGEKQLTTGRMGKLEVIEKGTANEDEAESFEEELPEQADEEEIDEK